MKEILVSVVMCVPKKRIEVQRVHYCMYITYNYTSGGCFDVGLHHICMYTHTHTGFVTSDHKKKHNLPSVICAGGIEYDTR